MKKILFTLFSLAVIGIACLSCKIGLGEAVDTQPPEVTITSPEVGAIIRDSFLIAGTWSDDGTIKGEGGLTVTLERTDDSIDPITYTTGKVDKDKGTWNCLIDYADKDNPLIDGEYQATIKMTDTYEHSTVKTVTFTIDNTAPIIVLQRPAAKKGDAKPDSYGQSFTLEGQAADDNNIDSIDVSLYAEEECTTLLHTVHLANVPPTIELDVAKFAEGIENDYAKIYGSSSLDGGTKQFYCKIIAYDGAQRYPADGSAQTDVDKKGNSVDHYYLYEEISGSVLNKYKITEVYHMHNGTYSGEAESRSAVIASVKETLASNQVNIGSFTLNPANNPTYTVSGRNPLVRDGHDFDTGRVEEVEISNGTKVQIEVATGLDGIALRSDTLGVYVIECDANGAAKSDASKIYIISPKEAKDGTQLITDQVAIDARSALIGKSGTSYKLTVTLDAALTAGLSFGKSYIFGVDGYDQNNTEVADFGSIYGFYFVSSGSAPKLEVTAPSNGITYVSKDSGIQVTGYSTADISYAGIAIKVYDVSDLTNPIHSKEYSSLDITAGKYSEPEIKTEIDGNNKHKVIFDYTVPKTVFNQTSSKQYTLSIIASNGEKETVIDRTIIYDVNGPTASIDGVEPTSEKYKITAHPEVMENETGLKEEGVFLNGDVTLKLSITDAYDVVDTTTNKPYFTITDNTGKELQIKYWNEGATVPEFEKHVPITTPAKQNFTIDTTALASGTTSLPITVTIYSWDRAGNAGIPMTKQYVVDQTTDIPVMLPNSPEKVSFTLQTKDNLTDSSNSSKKRNYISTGSTLLVNLIDDDGIKSLTVRRRDILSDNNYANDENGADDTSPANLVTKFPVDVTSEDSDPAVTPLGLGKTKLLNIPLPSAPGYYKFYIEIEDIKGNKANSGPFDIFITSPTPTISKITPNPSWISKGSNIISEAPTKFKNTIDVMNGQPPFYVFRKLPSEKWEFDNEAYTANEFENHPKLIGTITSSDPDASSFTWVDDTGLSPDTTTTYEYILQDSSHNESNMLSVALNVDSNEPTVTVEPNIPTVTDTAGKSFTFQGQFEDDDSLLKEVQLKITDKSSNSKTVKVNGTNSWVYALTFADTSTEDDLSEPKCSWATIFATEGEKTLEVKAIDNAGNYTTETKTFMYDKAAPTTTLSASPTTYVNKSNAKVTLTGTAYDSNGLKKITVQDNGADVETITSGTGFDNAKTDATKFIWTKDITYTSAKDGLHTYTTVTEDKSGDEVRNTTKTLNVTVDMTDPTISLDAIPTKEGTKASSYTFRGTISDGTLGSGIDTAYMTIASAEGKQRKVKVTVADNTWYYSVIYADTTASESGATGDTWADVFATKGTKTVSFEVTDKAGNTSNKFTYEASEIANTTFTYDTANPELKVDSSSLQQFMPANGLTITGEAQDDYKLAANALTIKEEFKSSAAGSSYAETTRSKNPTYNIVNNAGGTAIGGTVSGAWQIAVPLDKSTIADGTYRYSFVLKDEVGNIVNSDSYEITVDTTPPTISITTPASDTEYKNETAIAVQSFRFEGSISNENNLQSVYYKVLTSAQANTASNYAIPSGNLLTETTWTGAGWSVSSSTSTTWNFFQSFKAGAANGSSLGEGTGYKVYVYAIDKAGNVNTTPVSRTFDVDMAVPELTQNIDVDGTTKAISDKTASIVYFKGDNLVVTASATDSNPSEGSNPSGGSPATVEVKLDGTVQTGTSGTWTIPVSKFTEGTPKEITITAKDIVNKTTEKKYTVCLDTVKPTAEIISPAASEIISSPTKTIRGSLSDATSGIDSTTAKYSLKRKSNGVAEEEIKSGDLTLVGESWTFSNFNLFKDTETADNAKEGTFTLTINGKDKLGNAADPVVQTFYYDKAIPSLNVNSITTPTKENVTISGKAWDSNEIVKVEIYETKDDGSLDLKWIKTFKDSNPNERVTSEPDSDNYSVTFVVGATNSSKTFTDTENTGKSSYLADGEHVFTIKATDVSGNERTVQKTITVDTIKPEMSYSALPKGTAGEDYYENGDDYWYKNSSITISGTTSDATSGVSTVTYEIRDTDEGTPITSGGLSYSSATGTWNGTINLPKQGKNIIKVIITDLAGNTNSAYKIAYLDSKMPTTPVIKSISNGDVSITNPTAGTTPQFLSNGRKPITVNVTVEDDTTDGDDKYIGMDTTTAANNTAVSITKIGGTTVDLKSSYASGEYTITIPVSNAYNGMLKLTVKDKVGNSQVFDLFELKLDATKPEVTIKSPQDADISATATGTQVNGIIKLDGTAKDKGGADLASIDVCFNIDGTATGWQLLERITGNDLASWETSDIITTVIPDKTTVYVCVIASDNAGNRNIDTGTTTITDNTKAVYDTDGKTLLGLVPNIAPSALDTANKCEVIVDQDTDRPLIKVTNLQNKGTDTAESFVLMFGTDSTLEGIVSDDDSTNDAVITTFIASSTAFTKKTDGTIDLTGWTPTKDGNSVTYTKTNCGSTTYNSVTGDYSFTPADTADGTKSVYFYVKDNGGKEFCTNLGSETEHLAQPKQQYKSEGTVKHNQTAISYLSDSKAPEITNVSLQAFNKSSGSTTADKEGEPAGLGATCIVGGTKKTYIELEITATDDNNISEIEVELSDGTNTKPLKKSVTNDFKASGNVYTTKRIAINDFTAITDGNSGNVTVKIKVTDGSGLYSNSESLFVVDKKAAIITNITQSADELYGSVKFPVSGQPSETDVSKVYYGFTKNTTKPTTWTEIPNQKLSVSLVFDGVLNSTADGVHGKTLREYILDAYGLTDAQLSANDATKDLYIHFKVEDECGNIGYSYQKYSVIPNGDLPTLEITYPEDISSAIKVGGTLRCAGTSDIGPGQEVLAVYAQIDIGATPGSTWNTNWEIALTAFTDKYIVEDTGVKNNTELTRGIKVSGSPYSWNMAINGSTEFNTDPDQQLAVRFFAVGSTGKASALSTFDIVIDPNAPVFSDLKLIQKTENKSQAYSDDMWIKGQWYLTGKLTDENGVKYISYFDNANVETILVDRDKSDANKDLSGDITAAGNGLVTKVGSNKATGTNKAFDYTFEIPIGNTTDGAFGTITYRIDAIDATGDNNTATKTFTVNFDNKAPVFKAVENPTSNTELATTGLSIKQSNNGYTIDGKFDEEGTANANQSGFGRIVMYFTRTIGSTTNIIDPSVTKVKAPNNDNKNNYLALTGLTLDSTDGIYWKQMSASKITETCKLTVTSLPSYVRIGGVCKVDGILYRITNVASGVVTVDGVLDNTTTAKTVYFTPALVIDNFSTEAVKSGETYDGIYQSSADTAKLTNGDGDWLIEGVSKSGSSYPWTVTINSTNILDGPIDIHFTAYDAAGNIAKKTYSGSIANNAPRIAGVTVWTDYNGDNTGWRSTQTGYEDEAKSYYATQVRPTIGGKQVYRSKDVVDSLIVSSDGKVTDTTKGEGKAFMKITDQVKVIPEIVGGNGALGYTFNLSGNGLPTSGVPAGTGSALKKDDGTTTVNGTDASASLPTKTDADSVTYIDGNTDGVITFDTTNVISKLSNSSTENPTWFNIKIWDSTEGATQYTNTLNCEMKIALNVQYNDEISPKVVVSPFKWEGPTDNSLVLDGDDKPCGHIELEADLPAAFTTGGTGVNDRDPKVSGLIVIRGTAYDNIRLDKLYVSFENHSKIGSKTEAATYSSGVWTSKSAESALSSSVTINDQISNLRTKGWTFSAEDEYINSEGHKVNWELKIDTSLVSGVAALDKSFTIYADAARGDATNKVSSTSTSGTSGDITSYNKPTYKMDIVPYITEVVTKLAQKGGISYSRTALGHYPIATDETSVTLKGYNLASGNADKTIDPHSRETGAYVLTVNSVESFNNKNNNNAMGTFDVTGQSDAKKLAAKYNMQPDSSINNNLTDDIYFDMWQLNSNAATSGYPSLKYPVMHIDPSGDRNKIGFGFVKGSDSVSFPAAGKSYTWYQKNRKDYVSTNFVYDANGVAHTISIGLDGQFDTGIAGRMNYSSSNWYDANNNSGKVVKQWDTRYNVGLESIGIPNGVVIKGSKLNDTSGQGIIDIERFNTPSIAVASHGDSTAVYVMYYDSQNDQIRFRYGLVANNLTNRGRTLISNNAGYRAVEQFGLLNDSKSEQQRCTSVNRNNDDTQYIHSDEGTTGEDYNKHGMFEASKDYYALVTGQYYKQDHNNQAAFNTGNHGSMYCAMDVVAATGTNETMNDDKVVIVWYDPTTTNLMYIYRENLGASNANVSNVSASTAAVSSGGTSRWSAPTAILTGKPVQDVTIKVDSLGGIHIAAYDQNNADLIYMYKKTYNDSKVYSCTVDAYSQVGKSITIDVPLNSDGKAVPYISYYAEGLSSLPKLAYLIGGIDRTSDDTIKASIADGADVGTKLFSQKWEVTLLPTSSALQVPTASHSADVMIGTFRDADGKITKPSAGTDVVTSQDERTRYANGTTDLVVGYSIKTNGIGYIETAMRK